ncbi:hypothetical protein [Bermanella sp. R86510]|uniref:hypothetical protein n=1 Tax=unclassified Bermanella TaxID=2627862 RepID=UPI0037CA6C80
MKSNIKRLIFGLIIAIGSGVLGYLCTVLYLAISMNIQDSKELVDIIRSKQAMYLSLPYTFLCLVFANWVATRKLISKHYYIGLVIILITAAAITFGPLKIITIHTNYLPIVLGGLLGAYIGKKHNKRISQGVG